MGKFKDRMKTYCGDRGGCFSKNKIKMLVILSGTDQFTKGKGYLTFVTWTEIALPLCHRILSDPYEVRGTDAFTVTFLTR